MKVRVVVDYRVIDKDMPLPKVKQKVKDLVTAWGKSFEVEGLSIKKVKD